MRALARGVTPRRGARPFWFLLPGCLLLTLLFFASRPAAAADCFRYAGDVFVCDARADQPVFVAPTYPSGAILFSRTYSWLDDHAPLYAAPRSDAPVVEEGTVGILYYTIEESFTDGSGLTWYRVGDDLWARGDSMHVYSASRFSGVEVLSQPERPFGWVVQKFQPAPAADAEPLAGAPWIDRYTFIQIYDVVEGEEGWVWFDIGDGQWVKQTFLSLVDVNPRPEGVGPDDYWVDVDLFEQVFAAYEGDRLVYAGLISSGLDAWPTNEGLFTVYARHREWPMWGGDVGKDYYYLQDVPHTMFFDDDIALHGAYWHDAFGAQRSHGCVNMPVRDAEWVYNWSAAAPDDTLWVSVHDTGQGYYLERYGTALARLYGQLTAQEAGRRPAA